MLDLHRLRLLREVHARGTVHAAAEALGYSTSAVSQQLATLERELGTPLLERAGRRLRPTAAGLVLIARAEALLADAAAAEAEVAQVAAGRLAGVVRVAAFQSALIRLVAPAVAALARTHPGVRVEVTEAEVEQSAPELRLQHLDVALGDEYDQQPRPVAAGLTRTPVLTEPIHVVLPAGHPAARHERVRLADLAGAAWAACQPGTGQHQMHLRACRQLGGFEPDTRYTSDDFVILLELVRTAGAVALLPALALGPGSPGFAGGGLPGVVVRPVADAALGRALYTLTRASSPPTVGAVVGAIREAAGRVAPSM